MWGESILKTFWKDIKLLQLFDGWYEEAFVVGGIKSITTVTRTEFGSLKLARPVEVTVIERKSGLITWIVGHYVRVVGWNVKEIESTCHAKLLAKLRESKQKLEDAREELQDILSIIPEYNERDATGGRDGDPVQGGGQDQAAVPGPEREGQVRSDQGSGGPNAGQG